MTSTSAASPAGGVTLEPEPEICEKGGSGLILPLFGDSEQDWPNAARAIIYAVLLAWFFLGVSIIADIFMAGIEAITSKRKQHTLSNGQTVTVKVWNATVANLTLMALGSSAPEILLNVIEILGNSFYAGDLGPSTIVGSAAFNLLVIIAICVYVIPSGDKRTIEQMDPFIVSAFFSVFAYLWLIFVLALSSPDLVTVVEGVFTFLFFPLLVVLSYLADIGFFNPRHKEKKKNDEDELKQALLTAGTQIDDSDAQMLLRAENERVEPKSRAERKAETIGLKGIDPKELSVGFLSKTYCFSESTDKLLIEVEKVGNMELEARVGVQYKTSDGSMVSKAGHYVASWGYIEIPANAKYAQATIFRDPSAPSLAMMKPTLSPADKAPHVKEESEDEGPVAFFNVELVQACKLASSRPEDMRDDIEEEMAISSHAKVNILPDFRNAHVAIGIAEGAGRLRFDQQQVTIHGPPEDTLEKFTVRRFNGSQGEVRCKYCTEPDTAKPNFDYNHAEGELVFVDGVMTMDIVVNIQKKSSWEVNDRLFLVLSDVEDSEGVVDEGRSILGITITNDKAQGVANKFLRLCDQNLNIDSLQEGTRLWKEQWFAAFRPGGDEDDIYEASAMDWTIHIFALPWKLIFALVPPPVYCNGWACFIVALIMIGVVTAFIGDLASLLGCVMSVDAGITAITIVAVGTSLPDAFASKTAAIDDPGADNAIGNVTGSNSVNVFLGIGLPWMAASIYWETKKGNMPAEWVFRYPEQALEYPDGGFVVVAGDLVFSVICFTIAALVCIALIMYRRRAFRAELGGPDGAKILTCIFLVLLWAFYVGLAIWKIIAGEQSALNQFLAIVCGGFAVLLGMLILNGIILLYSYWKAGKHEEVKAILDHLNTTNLTGPVGISFADLTNTHEIVARLKEHIAGLNSVVSALEANQQERKFGLPAVPAPMSTSMGKQASLQMQAGRSPRTQSSAALSIPGAGDSSMSSLQHRNKQASNKAYSGREPVKSLMPASGNVPVATVGKPQPKKALSKDAKDHE